MKYRIHHSGLRRLNTQMYRRSDRLLQAKATGKGLTFLTTQLARSLYSGPAGRNQIGPRGAVASNHWYKGFHSNHISSVWPHPRCRL